MAFLDETGLAELWTIIEEGDDAAAKIETGGFSGTGSEVKLTFSFEPKVLVLEGYDENGGTYFKNTFVVATNYGVNKRIGIRCQGVADAGCFVPTITFFVNEVTIATNSNITNAGYTFSYVAFG